MFNALQRRTATLKMNEALRIKPFVPKASNFPLLSIAFELDLLVKGKSAQKVYQAEDLTKLLHERFTNMVFAVDQMLAMDVDGIAVKLQVKSLQHVELDKSTPDAPLGITMGQFIKGTTATYSKAKDAPIKIEGGSQARGLSMLDRGFNFNSMGIGGLDKEFSDIFRRAFASRVFPPDIVRKMGVNHVRGMLLYGAPGCGKTLIARQLAKALNAREPKLVSGPEILDKYVGQSEANIRALFEDAEKEQAEMGDNSELHIIIFDEIDAICKARGSTSDGSGVHDSIVNQLLAKIDGVDSLNNVLIMGMTNRKDLIDPALLRPGRFEVHIEIGLPDEAGRVQILNIHTAKMRENNILSSNVSIAELASRTKNFTGAEIEGLVKSAASFSFERQVDVNNLKKVDPNNLKVEKVDFDRALQEVHPAFGLEKEELSIYFRNGIINHGSIFANTKVMLDQLVHQVRTSEKTPLMSVILRGPPGCGKTALAAKIAVESEFPYVKIITADSLLGYNENSRAGKITNAFTDAYKTPLSMIILDDIERLMDYVALGPRFSNTILQALLVLVKKIPQSEGRRLLVIGTTSIPQRLAELGLMDSFNVQLDVPLLTEKEELEKVFESIGGIKDEELDKFTEAIRDPIPIKKLMMLCEMARDDNGNIEYDKFQECLLLNN